MWDIKSDHFVLKIKPQNLKPVSLRVSSDLYLCTLKNNFFSYQKIEDSGSFQWKKDYNIKDKCLTIAKGTKLFLMNLTSCFYKVCFLWCVANMVVMQLKALSSHHYTEI